MVQKAKEKLVVVSDEPIEETVPSFWFWIIVAIFFLILLILIIYLISPKFFSNIMILSPKIEDIV